MLKDAIERNRYRNARYDKAERLLRRLRQRIFDYEDESPAKAEKATRLMERCKARLKPLWDARHEAQKRRRSDAMMHTWT